MDLLKRKYLAWCFVAVLVSGCTTTSTSGRTPTVRGSDSATTFDLLAQFPVAVQMESLSAIGFSDPAERSHLPIGWSTFSDPKKGEPFAYGRGSRSVVEVPVISPKRMEISVTLSPPRGKEFLLDEQTQEVAAYWNGTLLRTMNLTSAEPEVFTMNVRPELQRYGINLFELRPWYWVRSEQANFGPPEEFSFRCYGITFNDAQVDSRTQPAFQTAEDGVLSQGIDSAFAEFLPIPEDAVLTGRVRAVSETETGLDGGRGLLVVSLLAEDGSSTMLESRRFSLVRDAVGMELTIPLDAYSGTMAGLTFSFHTAGAEQLTEETANSVRLEWTRLRVDGTGRSESPPERDLSGFRGPYNVLLVLFDTLRADHTQPYADTDVKTPTLLELADRGVTFTSASSNAPWTRPSVASIMTGNYPWIHQALRLGDALPEEMPTLPRLLKRSGYRTVAVINNNVVSDVYGFGTGFDIYRQIYENYDNVREISDPAARAERIWNSHVEPFLTTDGPEPFFVYLHELDPHSPYLPPAPFNTMYAPEYQSFVKSGAPFLVNEGLMTLRPEDVSVMHAQYKGEISFMDAYLGWILNRLEETGLDESTLVIFTSDHGEEFMEHGGLRHGDTLFEEQLAVPLMFSLKGTLPSGLRIDGAAESIDIVPTILDLLDQNPPTFIQGRSLLPQMAARGGYPAFRPTFAHNNYRYSIKWNDWKLVKYHDRNEDGVRTGIHHGYDFGLYDLKEDSGEQLNVWTTRLSAARALHQRLMWDLLLADIESRLSGEEIDLENLDSEMVDDLKALGYL